MIESIRINDLEISKSEMARRLGISPAHYGNIVSGIDGVSIKRAGEFAKILGHPEKLFVQYSLQDEIRKLKYKWIVRLDESAG